MTPDAGAGGGRAGGASGGGTSAGGVAGGGSAAGGTTAGGTTAGGATGGGSAGGTAGGAGGSLADGGAGMFTGPTVFPIVAARTAVVNDGGLMVTALYNVPPMTCTISPNPPFSVLAVRITNTDGGRVTTGTWPIDGVNVKVTRDDFLVSGQGPDGGEGLSGSVVLTRLEPGRSSGTFTANMQFYTGSSGTITGSWDAPVCP